jgi:hypothetical protein
MVTLVDFVNVARIRVKGWREPQRVRPSTAASPRQPVTFPKPAIQRLRSPGDNNRERSAPAVAAADCHARRRRGNGVCIA